MGKVSAIEDGLRSVSGLARLFGRDRMAIKRRLDAAKVQPAGTHAGHPIYRVSDAAAAIYAPSVGVGGDPENMPPKERLEWYRGNIERRKDALESGEVVRSEQARAAMAEVLKTTMLTLDTLTEAVGSKAKLTPDQSRAIESVIDDQRRALHKKLKEVAEARRASEAVA